MKVFILKLLGANFKDKQNSIARNLERFAKPGKQLISQS